MKKPGKPNRLSWAAAFVIIFFIGALLAGFIFYRIETAPMRSARQIRDIFGSVAHFQPSISVRNRVLFEQSAPITELAVIKKDIEIEHEFTHDWLGSTKRLKLRGNYTVKAGFDLRMPFRVEIEGKNIMISAPQARILSVEQVSVEVMESHDGIWNKVQPEDIAGEIATLPLLAREKAHTSGIRSEAIETLANSLRQKLGDDYHIKIQEGPENAAINEKTAHTAD